MALAILLCLILFFLAVISTIVLGLVLVFVARTSANLRSSGFRGWRGEMVVRMACRSLDKRNYVTLHNVTIPTRGDGTTQIDHVIVSRFGIFVVETKHYRGAIYGSEHDRSWTQAIGRQRNSFPNPLRQNYGHVMALAEMAGMPREKIKSVVMFTGSARIKTRDKLPANLLTRGLISYIKMHNELLLSPDDMERVLRVIAENRLAPNVATHRRHVQHLRTGMDDRRTKF